MQCGQKLPTTGLQSSFCCHCGAALTTKAKNTQIAAKTNIDAENDEDSAEIPNINNLDVEIVGNNNNKITLGAVCLDRSPPMTNLNRPKVAKKGFIEQFTKEASSRKPSETIEIGS